MQARMDPTGSFGLPWGSAGHDGGGKPAYAESIGWKMGGASTTASRDSHDPNVAATYFDNVIP